MVDKMDFLGAAIIKLATVPAAPASAYKRTITIKNIDLSDPQVDYEKDPAGSNSREPTWTPFDIDFGLTEIPENEVVKVVVHLAGNFVFQPDGLSITTANPAAAGDMVLLDDYKKNKAVFFVTNRKGIIFDFNIGVVYSKPGSQWELPVFIDPKIHNNGGGG